VTLAAQQTSYFRQPTEEKTPPTCPPNCDRVFTNSVGYVTNLSFEGEQYAPGIGRACFGGNRFTHASIAPAVVPAIREWMGFSFLDIMIGRAEWG
jgi:hypothetical protein